MKIDDNKVAVEGDLRVWHIPQVPMKSFNVHVSSPEEAADVIDLLWSYDDFQFKNKVKSDYSNATGLVVFEDGEWCDWYDDDDNDINDFITERLGS